jgi:hypothetical protein
MFEEGKGWASQEAMLNVQCLMRRRDRWSGSNVE